MKVFQEAPHKLVLPRSHGRSVGLHVSDVIRDYALTGKVLDAKWHTQIAIEEQNTNMMQLGLALENYLEQTHQHPEVMIHPGEWKMLDDEFCTCHHDRDCHRNGNGVCNLVGCGCTKFRPMAIYMSPDGLSDIDSRYMHLVHLTPTLVHEFKFTKKSSRDFKKKLQMREKKVRMWLWQIMAYCIVTGSLAAKLHVMFVNGDYSYTDDAGNATYVVFRLEFEQEEIDNNWQMLLQHARKMVTR